MIRYSTIKRLRSEVIPSARSVHQANGSSPLKVLGETWISFTWNGGELQFEGLAARNLHVDVVPGTPFMEANDVTICSAKCKVIVSDGTT